MSDFHSTQKITELALELGRTQVQAEMQQNHTKQLTEANTKMQEQLRALNADLQSLRQQLNTNRVPAGGEAAKAKA